MVERAVVHLADGHVWEITTENGTRHLVDLRDPDAGARRMRVPGPGRERSEDNVWIGRIGAICHRAMDEADDYNRNEVVVGEPCRIYGPGFGDWWTTTTVVAVRPVDGRERYLTDGAGALITDSEAAYFADLPKGSLPQARFPRSEDEHPPDEAGPLL